MHGGYLVLDGDSAGPFLKKPIQTSVKLDRFTVKEAPAISKVLNMASLTQIISTLTGTGLAFNSASGDLQLDGTRLSSRELRMQGGSLGLLISGWTDLKQQTLDLSGTVIPMSKINDIVGKVPLLGKVVTGKDGHGIMAVDFTVKGTIGQPEVSIKKESLTRDKLEDTLGPEIEGSVTDLNKSD